MRPETFGRALGIGLRVAGRVAGQRIGAAAPSPPSSSAPATPSLGSISSNRAASGRSSGNLGTALSRGFGGFFKSFRRAGGIVWLEVTGVFFFLPVLVFAPTLWRTRLSYAHGPDHRTFVAAAIVVVVFLYLGVTSFWRARRK